VSRDFHSYITLRNRAIAFADDERARAFAKSMTSAEYRVELLRRAVVQYGKATTREQRLHVLNDRSPAAAEHAWTGSHRPYWNCWPIAVELSRTVRLDLPFRSIDHPFKTVLIRFASGHELAGELATALIHWERPWPDGTAYIRVQCLFRNWPVGKATLQFRYRPDDLVEGWLDTLAAEQALPERAAVDELAASGFKLLEQVREPLIRLVVFIGLLAKGKDTITPVILAKDRERYDATDDPQVRAWLERRAARVTGRGFDVLKRLDQERESVGPHFRNPHLCLFWIGEGRQIPIIKLRSGSVVLRSNLDDVPTGYLGKESPADDAPPAGEGSTGAGQQTPIPVGQRFRILRRDGYRCQLCGRSQVDGVKLHVDHKLARVNGGSNDDENLWTLCEGCNLGKGDGPL